MMRKISLALALLAAGCAGTVLAESGFGRKSVGTSGAQFLKLAANARAVGMGEAYSAAADGADALFWNPAGLERVTGKSFLLMHSIYVEGIYYDFASYAQKIGNIGTFAAGFQYLGSDSIERTNEVGTSLGTFKPYDMAWSLAWGKKFKGLEEKDFSVGVAVKFIRSKIIETANTGAVDAGVSYEPIKNMAVAVGVQNVGGPLKFKQDGSDLPLNIRTGISWKATPSFLAAFDANFPRDNHPFAALGAEYKMRLGDASNLAFRGGYNSRQLGDVAGLSGMSLGLGLGFGVYSVDFGWVPMGGLGQTYRLSLSAKF